MNFSRIFLLLFVSLVFALFAGCGNGTHMSTSVHYGVGWGYSHHHHHDHHHRPPPTVKPPKPPKPKPPVRPPRPGKPSRPGPRKK